MTPPFLFCSVYVSDTGQRSTEPILSGFAFLTEEEKSDKGLGTFLMFLSVEKITLGESKGQGYL